MKTHAELVGQLTLTDEELADVLRHFDVAIAALESMGARYHMVTDDLRRARRSYESVQEARRWP